MKTYARIQEGHVAELFSTDGDITEMFHPDLHWVEAVAGVAEGDVYSHGVFSKPQPLPAPVVEQQLNAEQKLAAFLAANPDVLKLIQGAA